MGKLVGRKLCKNMHKEIKLEVDGKVIDLPCLEGIIILNIMRFVKFAYQSKYLRASQEKETQPSLSYVGVFLQLILT